MTRNLSFDELRAPLKPFQAVQEASRCLYCFDAPCRKGCPADIDVPGFIKALKTGNLKRAARLIYDANILGNSCGRVCPTELLCEKGCSTKLISSPIAIGALQSYTMDHAAVDIPGIKEKKTKKVAVIGSGPAGLACAAELIRLGYPVDIYESREKTGGMLRYGVPKYRLPERIIEEEVSRVKAMGVNFIVSSPAAEDLNKLLKSGYSAVFVASGLSKSQRLNIPGENLKGVHLAMDFLARVSEGTATKPGDKVAVIGGGDVAFDCARSALRLGARSVSIIYRRTAAEMPALEHEIQEGQNEGIVFNCLTAPEAIIDDGKGRAAGLQCVRMELGEPDSSGRRKPVPVKDSTFKISCDSVILAIGQAPSTIIDKMLPGAKKNSKCLPEVNSETLATSLPGIFAGGDIINGGTTVVQAVAEGKRAARGIDKYLGG